jgi:hypothetical protein
VHALNADQKLLETAKARAIAEREMAVSAERLFAVLEDGSSWTKVSGAIREVAWTSPKPFAVGTTRTVTFAGGIRIDEVFWTWERNCRMGFSVTAASTDRLRGLCEVYEITPLSFDRCQMRWVLAASLSGWLGRIEPVVARLMEISQRQMLKKLERVARDFPTPA